MARWRAHLYILHALDGIKIRCAVGESLRYMSVFLMGILGSMPLNLLTQGVGRNFRRQSALIQDADLPARNFNQSFFDQAA